MTSANNLEKILALEGLISKQQLADKLDFAGKDAEQERRDADSAVFRYEAAKRYDELGMLREAAFSYDRAGKSAGWLGHEEKRYVCRKRAMEIFTELELYHDAAFSAMHVVEALINLEQEGKAKESPEPYIALAEQLMGKAGDKTISPVFFCTHKKIVEIYLSTKNA